MLYDYEFGKLIGRVNLPENDFFTAMKFLDGYSLLIVATSSMKVFVINIESKDYSTMSLECLGVIDPNFSIQKKLENSMKCTRLIDRQHKKNPNTDKAPNPYFSEKDSYVDKI